MIPYRVTVKGKIYLAILKLHQEKNGKSKR